MLAEETFRKGDIRFSGRLGTGRGLAETSRVLDTRRPWIPVRLRHLSGETRKQGLLPLASTNEKHDLQILLLAPQIFNSI